MQHEEYNTLLSGVSCTVLVIKDSEIFLAQVGDTRAFVFRNQSSKGMLGKQQYVQVTRPHLPKYHEEKMRIYRSGGEVKKWAKDQSERIFFRGRNYPGILTTRSIGDRIAKRIGVISDAEFTVIQRFILFKFLIFLLLSINKKEFSEYIY